MPKSPIISYTLKHFKEQHGVQMAMQVLNLRSREGLRQHLISTDKRTYIIETDDHYIAVTVRIRDAVKKDITNKG